MARDVSMLTHLKLVHQPFYNSTKQVCATKHFLSSFSLNFKLIDNKFIISPAITLSFVKDEHNTLHYIDFDFSVSFYKYALRRSIPHKIYSRLILFYFDLAQIFLAIVLLRQ